MKNKHFPVTEEHIKPIEEALRRHLPHDPLHPDIIRTLQETRHQTAGITETGMFRIVNGAIQRILSDD